MTAREHAHRLLAAGVGPLALAAAPCASAKTIADCPPLDMPAPPPRVVEAIEARRRRRCRCPTSRRAAAAAARRRPAPPPRRRAGAGRARAGRRSRAADRAAEAGRRSRRPPPTLQTTPAAAEGEVERAIRAHARRARPPISNRIDYRGAERRRAGRSTTPRSGSSRQAEDALRAKNLVFAQQPGRQGASPLAAQLAGR